jgi:cellulose synthase/poly-beta-1,6-N-acetylglucosamine synthase-like glycosyltransferase
MDPREIDSCSPDNEHLYESVKNPSYFAGSWQFLMDGRKWWLLPPLFLLLLIIVVLPSANSPMILWIVLVASTALTLPLIPWFAYLAWVTAAALLGGRVKRVTGAWKGTTKFVFVIPAHDEEGGIASTVMSCRDVDYPLGQFRVVVIADNCIDQTAEVAREAGAEVLERTDLESRGKGYALSYFFRAESPDHPSRGYDAVVVVDADTEVDRSILTAFAERLADGHDWLQCYNTVRNPDESWRTQLMTLAFSLFNGLLLIGQNRSGLSIALRGNGMCLSSRGLARHPWQAHGLTEDVEFSWMLRSRGERIEFVPTTRVLSDLVSSDNLAAKSQRLRWEEGRRSMRAKFRRDLLVSSDLTAYQKVMYLLELYLPPLVPLTLSLTLAASAQLFVSPDPVLRWLSWLSLSIHGIMTLVLLAYLLSPFVVLRLPWRYLRSLRHLPRYAVWKLMLAWSPRPSEWVRTPRELRSDGARLEPIRY